VFGFMGDHELSESDPSLFFLFLGIILCIIGVISLFIESSKRRDIQNILTDGYCVKAEVISVKRLTGVRVHGKTPFIIKVMFNHMGSEKVVKSHLLWEEPLCEVGNPIDVCVVDNVSMKYVVKELS